MTTAIVPAEKAETGPPVLHVVFRVGASEYALPASSVLQMESYAGATPVPGTLPYVAGILQLRGRVIPVVDLRARFGLPPAPHTLDTRVVVGDHLGRVVALVADSAREVTSIAPSQQRPPPRLVEEGAGGFVKALAQLDKRIVLVLDFAKVIGEEAKHV